MGCKLLNIYEVFCFNRIFQDIIERPNLYINYMKILLDAFYTLKFLPRKNFVNFLILLSDEIKKSNSLDGLNKLILYMFLGKTENELTFINNYINDYENFKKNEKNILKNKKNFKLVLQYLQLFYPENLKIQQFVEENSTNVKNTFFGNYEILIDVKTFISLK